MGENGGTWPSSYSLLKLCTLQSNILIHVVHVCYVSYPTFLCVLGCSSLQVLVLPQDPLWLLTRSGVITTQGRTPSLNNVLEAVRSMLKIRKYRPKLAILPSCLIMSSPDDPKIVQAEFSSNGSQRATCRDTMSCNKINPRSETNKQR
jgi:hypothetical protein